MPLTVSWSLVSAFWRSACASDWASRLPPCVVEQVG